MYYFKVIAILWTGNGNGSFTCFGKQSESNMESKPLARKIQMSGLCLKSSIDVETNGIYQFQAHAQLSVFNSTGEELMGLWTSTNL